MTTVIPSNLIHSVNTENLLSGHDWEIITSLYMALACLHVEYDAQFGGLQ